MSRKLRFITVRAPGSPVVSRVPLVPRQWAELAREMTPAELAKSEEQAERWQGYEDADRS